MHPNLQAAMLATGQSICLLALMPATSPGLCIQTCWPSCLQPVKAYSIPNCAGPLACNWSGHMCIQTCWPSCLQPSPGCLHTDLLAPGAALLTIPPPHVRAASSKILHAWGRIRSCLVTSTCHSAPCGCHGWDPQLCTMQLYT